MAPMLPKRPKAWRDDPGHIADAPEPPPMPDEQEDLGPGESIPAEPTPGGPSAALRPASQPHTPAGEAEEVGRFPDGEAVNPADRAAGVPDEAEVEVPRALAQEIRRAMKRYPQKRSASIPALWAVQRRYGWCSPEGIRQAAAVMQVTPGFLQSVASFYDLFRLEPEGKHQVLVCTNISCWLRGADDVLGAFKEAGAADDAHIRGFECLGACDMAPMASIDERYYGPLEPGDAALALEQMRTGEEVLPRKRLIDRGAAGGMRAGADDRVTSHPLNKPKRPRPKTPPKRTIT
jgi:NADH-quinone oxidoreductase subunit E